MKDHRLAVGRVFLLATLLALLPAISTLADQTQVRNYDTARRLVWGLLYASGGSTLYCGEPIEDNTDLNVEHIYWDHASVLVQLGVLDAERVPALGGEQAQRLLDPDAVANRLMEEWMP